MNTMTREEVIKEVENLTQKERNLIDSMWYKQKKTYEQIADALKGTYTIEYWEVVAEYLKNKDGY